MRALAFTACMTAVAAFWACSDEDAPAADAGVDAEAGPPIDAGDGTCSVDKPFDAPVLVTKLSQPFIEKISATLSDDERRIVFSLVDDLDAGDDAGEHTALFEAERAAIGDAFETSQPLSTLNTVGESYATLSTDFLTVYFYSLREDPTKSGSIFMATRPSLGDTFGTPVKVDTLDIETYRSSPHLARHAREIWFAAATRTVEFRIYSAKLRPDGLTEAPVMAKELSISGLNATHPVLAADGLSIYWRAYGVDADVTNGGGDIWVATRSSVDGPFEALQPVVELNSPNIDEPSFLSRDRCRLYFMSGRSTRKELYVASRAP